MNFIFIYINKLLSSNLFSGFAGVIIGGFITYFISNKLEKNKQKEKQKLLTSLINDILKQIKVILDGSLGPGKLKSLYGYIKSAHEETNTIVPLFDNIISEISIFPACKNKTLTIELYTELKYFLANNAKYKIKLENLRRFRKEMIPETFVKLKCENYMDYFDLDEILFTEEQNPNSVISKDFFKAQKILIEDLNLLTDLTFTVYSRLINKINTIINNSWENKNVRK